MRVLELPAGASPRRWGQIHGESFRGEVRALSAIRTYLCTRVGAFPDRASVLAAAEAHLPVLARYHAGLSEELLGIAEGAGVTPAEVVVANHYTDLRDLSPDPTRWRPAPETGPDADGGCSVIWAETPTGRILAQTWDMHATAIPYVMMLHVPASADGPEAWVFTLTGCLGLTGMSTARVAVGINNLYSTDATLGVVWPAMVRRALHQPTAAAARDVVLGSPVGSGHHYMIADRKDAFAIETSGVLRRLLPTGPSYCHTNHCLDPEVAAVSSISPTSTTRERMRWLEASLGARPIADLADVWTRMGSQDGWPRSITTNMSTPENPHGTATCGAVALNLDTGEVWAQAGFVTNVAAERFQV
ncbi:MAG: C45 family peptidase [Deltaproteobacteria bacterium]|nr:C45 family peptidase [Kofleriaceae bacterium]